MPASGCLLLSSPHQQAPALSIYGISATAAAVRLRVTDYVGCKDTMTKAALVNVSGRPTAAFTMDDTINVCPPLIVNFTNKSTGAVRYSWSFGTGATSTLTNPSNPY